MEFHVWDFPEQIEVRFNDDFIDRIRNMTIEKRVHVQEKRGRKRDYMVTKKVKLIAYREGHPYHKIAERLYPKLEWHGKGRNRVRHKPFISVKQFFKVHKVTGLPLEEMERNVIEVRNHWAGHLEIPMKLPVVANEEWAWLLGLYFSCGGLITRRRSQHSKGDYIFTERCVRFRVDSEVFEKKVKPLLRRTAYVPELTEVWYAKKGVKHPMDKGKRKGVGNQPKKIFVLVRPIREIMEKFGLPNEYPSQKRKRGAKYGARKFHLKVPDWIKEKSKHTHAFVEGYINGGTMGSFFYRSAEGHLTRMVEIRFCAFNKKEVLNFYRFFEAYLTSLGITGYPHKDLHVKTSKLHWCGYLIFRNSALSLLYEKFDIAKPDLRSRLTLNYFMNALLYEACRELDSSEILVLGALIEKPLSKQNLTEMFRFRPEAVDVALRKLEKLDIAMETDGGKWRVNPTGYRDSLIERLWAKEMRRRKTVLARNSSFFSKCNQCGNVIAHNYTGPCGCGGSYHPISRLEALSKYRKGYMAKIRKLINERIPTKG